MITNGQSEHPSGKLEGRKILGRLKQNSLNGIKGVKGSVPLLIQTFAVQRKLVEIRWNLLVTKKIKDYSTIFFT